MGDVEITALKNGPYRVTGVVKLVDRNGVEYELNGQEAYLCRCGNSSAKPFCDGSHVKCHFEDEAIAA